MSNMISCSDCGNIWSMTESLTCTNVNYCPVAVRTIWAAASSAARSLAVEFDADDGTNADLWSRSATVDQLFSAVGSVLPSVTEDQSARTLYLQASKRWIDRRSEAQNKRNEEEARLAKLAWHRVAIGNADVTEHVAAMFDAIVASLDWGSGMLSSEEIESILIVGHLAGFDVSKTNPQAESAPPDILNSYDDLPTWEQAANKPTAFNDRKREIVAAWRRQIEAKARALAGDE